MADSCCESKGTELAMLNERQGRVLWVVLAINAVLFVAEFTVGWFARSTALLADSLDMLGDSFVYAFSLWVLGRNIRWKNRAALTKGYVQLAFGLLVLGQAITKMATGVEVHAYAMGLMGAIALAGNGLCFWLLWSHRSDDLNMRSTWLCSRNDVIANTGVIGAAALAAWLGTGWPDVIIGLAIAGLFLRTAGQVIAEARAALAHTCNRLCDCFAELAVICRCCGLSGLGA